MPKRLRNVRFAGTLRASQEAAVRIIRKQLQAGERELHIVSPPGSGKTVLGLYVWADLVKRPALVLSPNSAIQAQWTARAKELFYLSSRLDAAECLRLGVANRVVPDAEIEKAAFALAAQIAAGPPIALRSMKDNLNRALTEDLRSLLDVECDRMVQSAQTEDYVEAVKAFQEKRAPEFKGR